MKPTITKIVFELTDHEKELFFAGDDYDLEVIKDAVSNSDISKDLEENGLEFTSIDRHGNDMVAIYELNAQKEWAKCRDGEIVTCLLNGKSYPFKAGYHADELHVPVRCISKE